MSYFIHSLFQKGTKSWMILWIGGMILFFGNGCVSTSYYPLQVLSQAEYDTRWKKERYPQIETGKPYKIIDGLGHYFFSLPSKLLILDWSIENHRVNPETIRLIENYLRFHGLVHVKVRINQYAPGGEWIRLFKNKEMPAVWRYTFGVLSVVYYTIFPGRVFGGDHYNPYTNTINLYSDNPAVALHECAHARDFAAKDRQFRGLYSILGVFPLVTLYQEAVASHDALSFLSYHQQDRDLENSRLVLYPAYGSYLGSVAVGFMNVSGWMPYPIVYGTAWTLKGIAGIQNLVSPPKPEPLAPWKQKSIQDRPLPIESLRETPEKIEQAQPSE